MRILRKLIGLSLFLFCLLLFISSLVALFSDLPPKESRLGVFIILFFASLIFSFVAILIWPTKQTNAYIILRSKQKLKSNWIKFKSNIKGLWDKINTNQQPEKQKPIDTFHNPNSKPIDFSKKSERNQQKANAAKEAAKEAKIKEKQEPKKYLDDAQIKKLYLLGSSILDDYEITLKEAKKLKRWGSRNAMAKKDFRTSNLVKAIDNALSDDVLDDNEENEIFTLLSEFCDTHGLEEYPHENNKSESTKGNIEQIDNLEFDHQYCMIYKDASGNTSERNIIFKGLKTSNNRQYIKAVCLKRHAARTFRCDRIQELFSIETGELII